MTDLCIKANNFIYLSVTDDVRAPIPQTRGILVEPFQGKTSVFPVV